MIVQWLSILKMQGSADFVVVNTLSLNYFSQLALLPGVRSHFCMLCAVLVGREVVIVN